MSVLIKGMEMPQRCMGCTLCYVGHMGDIMCEVLRRPILVDGGTGRDKFCPLISIPTPHGRLIDADVLVRIWTGAKFYGSIKPIVDARPTVIEAEE